MPTVVVAPTETDFELPPHADLTLQFTLKDSAGDPIDLSNDDVTMIVFRRPTDAEPLFTVESIHGAHYDAVGGTVRLPITPYDTEFIEGEEEVLRYEVWRTYLGTKVLPYFAGAMYFKPLRGL